MNDSKHDLREVYDYPRVAAIISRAAKKKRVGFDVASLKDGEISNTKDNIVILGCNSAEFLNRPLECEPRGVT